MDRWFDLLGTRCRITCTDEVTAHRLDTLLAPFDTTGPDTATDLHATIESSLSGPGIVLAFRGEHHEGARSPALARLIAQLTAAAIEGFPGFAVHAGVVSRDGRAVVLAAASGVGKSTLTAACLLRGFDYVSDEALCVPPGEHVAVPFPKPLALGAPSARLVGLGRERLDTKDLLPPAYLGARIAEGPVVIDHVVSLTRSGEGHSEPEEMARSTAVATLLGMSFNAHRDKVQALGAATAIAQGARSWRLDVGDPLVAADALYELAGGSGG